MRLLREIRSLVGNYHVKSGVYHYYRNEYKQAVDYLRRALGDDSMTDADRRKAEHYLTLSLMDSATRLAGGGEPEQAVEELRQAVHVSPSFPDLHYRMGRILETLDSPERAIEAYRRAIESNPGYLQAQIALGFCLLGAGQPEEAAAAFEQAAELKRRQVEEPFQRGVAALRGGDTRQANELFHEAFLAVPQLSDEFVQKALTRLRAEDYEEALVELDRALALNPKYPDLHNYRGIALCELERVEEGIDAFRLSAALSPGYLIPRLNLAFAHLRAGEYREAETELEAILGLDPTESAASAKLEELRTGRPPEKRRSASRGSVR